ncbi:MAG TPA: outer membrane beta-barrel protein, partial [Pseudorhizobium sp.]|nr:outer membrane beta-barrel protein [Pseudorhizobium sp.]
MKQGSGRHVPQQNALALLLACSALVAPVQGLAQTIYPEQQPNQEGVQSYGLGRNAPEGTWASASPVGVAPLRPSAAAASTSPTAQGSEAPTGPAVSATATPAPGIPDPSDTALTTASTALANGSPVSDPPYADDLNQPYEDLLNPPADEIEPGEDLSTPVDPTGIRLGTLLLRPSISQSINRETIKDGTAKSERNYLGTTIRGTLTSDWSRHELLVTGETLIERNLGGGEEQDPEGQFDANLRLDLSDDTVANISAGYDFERQDNSDPNAVGGASAQSTVHEFGGGLTLERDAGILRGLAGLTVNREVYGDARLQDGSRLDLSDRDRTTIDGRLRLGYELSPALIPFVEIRGGRSFYDRTTDTAGFERSSWAYGGRAGAALDLGEKLRGELGVGYDWVDYDDGRLATLGGVAFDGRLLWSPQRGTDLELALRTTLEDAAAPGASGWVEYDVSTTLTHQLRHNLFGRLTGGATLREFPSASDETTWISGAGVTWSLNRYLDLNTA